MARKVNPQTGNLFVIWCDRCNRVVNTNDEKEHFHAEQCGGCRKFAPINGDFGHCRNRESVYCGRVMFEHDTCSKWLSGNW